MELNILKPNEIKNDLLTFFRNKSIFPIVGAGLSCGANTRYGKVPNGTEYKKHMINELIKNNLFTEEEKAQFEKESFSILCDYYEDNDNVIERNRYEYLKQNFYDVDLDNGDVRRKFFEIEWPYIYSLNIDDMIEKTSQFNRKILPYRDIREEIFNEEKCIIKLHGDIGEIVSYKDGSKIFTSKEYALSLEKNAPLLNKLRNDYANQNILFIGCSLDDEIDLKAIGNLSVNFHTKENLRKTLFFTKGTPGKLQQSKYKQYGITDIICFEKYDYMYEFLHNIWKESKMVQKNELAIHSAINIAYLKKEEKDKNQEYFFWGKGLFDPKNKTMTYPYFFIGRIIKEKIILNFSKNKVHLISGNRISGKTYLLADLHRTIRDREVFFLDGKSRISDSALNELIEQTNIIVLFDIGTINREQFEIILKNAKKINMNSSNFVININMNDSDTLGIVKWKLKQNIIESNDILNYTLSNKLLTDEAKLINDLLPPIYLPPYRRENTLLDQVIYTEKVLQKRGKYSQREIKINSVKQLAFLLVLAIKEKLYSLDIINFAFDQEVFEALKKYDPFIERVEVFNYEKDNVDVSTIKYILNSKYWLRRELGAYAQQDKNHEMIANSYQYIVQKIIESSGKNEYTKRKKCRDYILFDVMNDIFLDQHGGNIKLIVYVYSKLHGQMSHDYHFLHQNAKCFLNYSYCLSDIQEKVKYLQNAKELAILSKTIIDKIYSDYSNERLLISMAHVQYTIATIFSEICKIEDYLEPLNITRTINEIKDALYSLYNNDEYQQERKQRTSKGIVRFIREANSKSENLNITNDSKKILYELMNSSLFEKYGNIR